MNIIIQIILIALCIILLINQVLFNVHMIQLNSYNVDQVIMWYKKNAVKLLFIFHIKREKAKKKLVFTKRIIRIIVLLILIYVALLILSFNLFKLNGFDNNIILKRTLILSAVFMLIAPIVTLLSYIILVPIEAIIRKIYISKAKNKLKDHRDLNIIGLTGSFGKTSVKNFLYKLLSIKYNTCKTPESYNTPMGIVLTINNELKNYDEMFITEMGARRIGDIKELCDIVNPIDAIVTEVGNMHLDTFKTIDNVIKTKMELVDNVVDNIKLFNERKYSNSHFDISLKNNISRFSDSIVLLNGDNEYIRKYIVDKNYDNDILSHIYYIGEKTNNDFYISDIKSSTAGTSFNFSINCIDRIVNIINKNNKNISQDDNNSNNDINANEENNKISNIINKTTKFTTKLIGKHNVIDISFGIAFSLLKGVSIDDLIYGVKNIDKVKNRLDVNNIDSETVIVNDAYNSNPIGSKNAVDAISFYEDYKKVIITPGMVELKDLQEEENKKFAKYASSKLDYVFIIGTTNKEALLQGAMEGYKNKCNINEINNDKDVDDKNTAINENEFILYFDKVEDAMMYARLNVKGKKVILLENDLTDNY